MEDNFLMVAKTFNGMEELLAEEITALGGKDVEVQEGAVRFEGNKELMYKANFHLRTALRILKPIYSFKASNEDQLYEGMKSIDWQEFMTVKTTFTIDAIIKSKNFPNMHYVGMRLKDAIIDQFRERTEKRPYADAEKPQIRINVLLTDEEIIVSLDSTGESLHKRGYRLYSHHAPLNEVMAAGLIKMSGWDMKKAFIDPMCGSGTLLIEAALMAYNIPPGVYRKEFGFEKWLDFDADLFQDIFDEELPEPEELPQIIGCDMAPKAIRITTENLKNAGLLKKIDLYNTPIEKLVPPEEPGLVMTNPPYSDKMRPNSVRDVFKKVGDQLKNEFHDYDAWIVTSGVDALRGIGLAPSKRLSIKNGGTEYAFNKYEIYQGSKKEE